MIRVSFGVRGRSRTEVRRILMAAGRIKPAVVKALREGGSRQLQLYPVTIR
jgi:hypothetical protein